MFEKINVCVWDYCIMLYSVCVTLSVALALIVKLHVIPNK